MVESSTPVHNDKTQPRFEQADIADLPLPACIIDRPGSEEATVSHTNTHIKELLGYDPKGVALNDLLPPRVRSSHTGLAASLLAKGEQRAIQSRSGLETSIVGTNSEEIPVTIGVTPNADTDQALVILHDNTAEQKLDALSAELEMERAKLHFAAERSGREESVLRFGVFIVYALVFQAVAYSFVVRPESGADLVRELTVLAITNTISIIGAYAVGRQIPKQGEGKN